VLSTVAGLTLPTVTLRSASTPETTAASHPRTRWHGHSAWSRAECRGNPSRCATHHPAEDVGGTRPGTFAERWWSRLRIGRGSQGWTDEQASGATLVYLTAFQALTMWGSLPPSSIVLVTGASGAWVAASPAAAMGHTVIGLSRSPEKCRQLLQCSASATFSGESGLEKTPETAICPTPHASRRQHRRQLLPGDRYVGRPGPVSVVGRLAGPVPNSTLPPSFSGASDWRVAVSAYTNTETREAWGRSWSCWRDLALAPLSTASSRWTNCCRRSSASRRAMGKCSLALDTGLSALIEVGKTARFNCSL
jgi:NADPH:quinone reductase-like Zn-dependent oxidoreductase